MAKTSFNLKPPIAIQTPLFPQNHCYNPEKHYQPQINTDETVYKSREIMGNYKKLILKILSGSSDANIGFTELTDTLKRLGFSERIRGSHHIYRKQGIEEKINLQKDGAKAKPYQVRQVRALFTRHQLTGDK